MTPLSRFLTRTPSLRTRVAFATAIAAAIVVGIVGTVVWIGITTVRKGDQVTSNSKVVLPQLPAGYADTYVNGVRYRVRTVEIRAPELMSVAVGDTYDATIADTNNLHRRVIIICLF